MINEEDDDRTPAAFVDDATATANALLAVRLESDFLRLERMECLIPQLNESVGSVSCVRHDYSVVSKRVEDVVYYSIVPLDHLTNNTTGTNLFEVYTKSLKTGVTETQTSLQKC